MNINKLRLLYFSPTQTTKKVLEGIAAGFKAETVENIDLTFQNTTPIEKVRIGDGLTIIGVPVYSGRIPPDAVKRITKFEAEGTPAVLVVLYGNREFEDALRELKDLAVESGFKPIAGGAFIGEHSFANQNYPIALHRPDDKDIRKCLEFGNLIQEKLQHTDSITNIPVPELPGSYPYREPNFINGPITIEEQCTLCGICASVCPTDAITLKDKVLTYIDTCIACCACVKNCPSRARVMDNSQIQVAKRLQENYSKRKEPEFFI